MDPAALLRDSLGRVKTGARRPEVHAVVGGFADGLDVLPFVRQADTMLHLERTLRWGHLALTRSREALGYAEVAVTVQGVLTGLLDGQPELARGN
jgi:hypothetical protein